MFMALTQLAATNAAAESKEKRDVNGFQWISGFGMHGRLPCLPLFASAPMPPQVVARHKVRVIGREQTRR